MAALFQVRVHVFDDMFGFPQVHTCTVLYRWEGKPVRFVSAT